MTSAPLPYRSLLWLICLGVSALAPGAAWARTELAQASSAPAIVGVEIGFQGAYKLGCWTPCRVDIQGGDGAWTGHVEVTHPDTDAVPTRVTTAGDFIRVAAGQTTQANLLVRVGQATAEVKVTLVAEDGSVAAERSFYTSPEASGNALPSGLPATNRMLLEFGPTLGLEELVRRDQRSDQRLATRIARVDQAEELPTRWIGYESFETVILCTSDPEPFQRLQTQPERRDALLQWVHQGGQLMLFCASSADELLSDGGVLADFAPGRYEQTELLTRSQPLETFSGSEQAITRNRRISLPVPSLVDVRGKILASAGRSATNVPLVVRSRVGLGEVVFVGLDFDQAPLSDWPGRTSFFKRLFNWQDGDKNQQIAELQEADDLSGHLRNSLDRQFTGVQLAPFGLVAFLVGAYILLIGPGDFWLLRRLVGRTEFTWLTFPLIVVGLSVAAYAIANYLKGDELRVNQVEIVDVDCSRVPPTDSSAEAPDDSASNMASNLVRGTVWTHFFTPEVSQFDLSLSPTILGQPVPDDSQQIVSWLGLPGYSLGGMQADASQTAVFDQGYQYDEQLNSLQQLPVPKWSTKTLTARWTATVKSDVTASLQQDGGELLVGQLANDSEVELEDCVLMYGRWAYDLGKLKAGGGKTIDDSLQPRTVKTLLTNAAAGDEAAKRVSEDGTVSFATAQWDVARLVKAMMFYRAINGPRYTGKIQRYQPFVDLSTILEHDDKAILFAKCSAPASQWVDRTEWLPDGLASEQDRRWTYYRFVFHVGPPSTDN